MRIPRRVCKPGIFLGLIFAWSLPHGLEASVPEPVNFNAAITVQPLKTTGDTVLSLTFDASGKPVLAPASFAGSFGGVVRPGNAKIDLPGFGGIVRMGDRSGAAETEEDAPAPEAKKKGMGKGGATNYVEIPSAAALLGQGAFTLDLVLRFSSGDGNFLEAGTDAPFVLGMLDRDAGQLTIRAPFGASSKTLAGSAMTEKTGPLARDRFQLLTLIYDGEGGFAFYIDGTECFREKVEGFSGPLALKDGPIRLGDVAPSKSRFFGDLAAMRIQKGVHPPEAPVTLPAANGGLEGWAFDAGVGNAPTALGYQRVTPKDIFGVGKTFGWTAEPVGTTDMWFVGEKYSAKAEQVIEQKTRRARAWQFRDAILLPSGEGFEAKVAPGLYAVSVTLGRTDIRQYVDKVEANGAIIGTNLITLADTAGDSHDRTARDFVQVGPDGKLRITAISRTVDGKTPPVGFMSVTAQPVGPLPVERAGNNLVWKGQGPEPAGFAAAAKSYAARDFDGAFAAAKEIPDLFARATTQAWIVGYPALPDEAYLTRLTGIHDDLLAYLRLHPDDLSARYLEDLTLRFWHAAEAYVFQKSTSRIYGSMKGRAWREGLNLALQVKPSEPYFGSARTLAGNFIWQYGQQSGGGYLDDLTWRKPVKHDAYLPPPPLFREVIAMYPDAGLPKVFLASVSLDATNKTASADDSAVPARDIPAPANAPEWAVFQHRAITRLIDLVAYWHDHRMVADGTMGGGFGDDVEMMRWWKTAVLVGGDEKAMDGWQRLAATGWEKMKGQPMPEDKQDAEHVAEDFADSHGLQPFLHVGDEQYDTFMGRSRLLLPILKDVIMIRDPQGYLVFKSWSYSRNDGGNVRGDVPYNIRTIQPLCIYAYMRPEDKEAADLLVDYARSWRDITLQELDGKPAGLTPMMITHNRAALKQAKGDGRLVQPTDWVYPGYWTYEYPNGYTNHIYDLCLGAYTLSGDKSFLDPHKKALELLGRLEEGGTLTEGNSGSMGTNMGAKGTGDYDESRFARGSLDWAIRINRAGLGLAGAQYRFATGDKSYDDVLLKHGPAYTKFVILAERAKTPEEMAVATKALTPTFAGILNYLDYNEVLRTTLPQSTDRVWVPGMDFLESTATGDLSAAPPPAMRGEEEIWPTFGATWKKTGADVSILVTKNSTSKLDAYLYNFLETPKTISGHLWNLAPGRYRLRVFDSPNFKDGRELASKEIEVKGRGQAFDIDVPSQAQTRLLIEPVGS